MGICFWYLQCLLLKVSIKPNLCSIFVFACVPSHMLFKIPTSFLQGVIVFFIMGEVHELGPVLLSKACKFQYTKWIALELVDQQELSCPHQVLQHFHRFHNGVWGPTLNLPMVSGVPP